MTTTEQALKDCPFCGSTPYAPSIRGTGYIVECQSCWASTWRKLPHLCVESWNRRAPTPVEAGKLTERRLLQRALAFLHAPGVAVDPATRAQVYVGHEKDCESCKLAEEIRHELGI